MFLTSCMQTCFPSNLGKATSVDSIESTGHTPVHNIMSIVAYITFPVVFSLVAAACLLVFPLILWSFLSVIFRWFPSLSCWSSLQVYSQKLANLVCSPSLPISMLTPVLNVLHNVLSMADRHKRLHELQHLLAAWLVGYPYNRMVRVLDSHAKGSGTIPPSDCLDFGYIGGSTEIAHCVGKKKPAWSPCAKLSKLST